MALNDGTPDPLSAERMWERGGALIGAQGTDGMARPVSPANPLPMTDARPPATDALYALSGNGAATALPAGAQLVELTAVGSDLWFRFGGNGLGNTAAPSAAAAGGAPRYLPQGASILVDVRTATRYTVASAGAYSLAWWTA